MPSLRRYLTALVATAAVACTALVDLPDEGQPAVTGGGGDDSPPCESPQDCPAPTDPCEQAICLAGECGSIARSPGALAGDQETGNCLRDICDAAGEVDTQNDDSDVPLDDDGCTDDVCVSGVPDNKALELGDACGPGLMCTANGACVECITAADCTNIPDTECQDRTCIDGECVAEPLDDGTPVLHATGDDGDCMVPVCDGRGGIRLTADLTDSEDPDDGNDCTDDACQGGVAMHAPLDADNCGAGGVCVGSVCNGCSVPSDCDMSSSACVSYDCINVDADGGECDIIYQAPGTPLSMLGGGDCLASQCNGAAGEIIVADPNDPPADDGNDCTGESCKGGMPYHPDVPVNSMCDGGVCNETGGCVECNTVSQCGPPPDCQAYECQANVCVLGNLDGGELSDYQTPGDCLINVCDGNGSAVSEPQDTDHPDDGIECTGDDCEMGVQTFYPADPGVVCMQGGGSYCNGHGECVECAFDVHCGSGNFCDQTVFECMATLGNGERCTRDEECSSAECVDGVCCDGPCAGKCRACTSAKTGGTDGKCGTVRDGTDPDNECAGTAVCVGGGCSATPMMTGG